MWGCQGILVLRHLLHNNHKFHLNFDYWGCSIILTYDTASTWEPNNGLATTRDEVQEVRQLL
jgi:hypothetical protein